MTTESRKVSFAALTSNPELAIRAIEIPRFQRDYAQGRQSNRVEQIRADFLDALLAAIGGEDPAPVGLDFVYGGVDEGTFRPLDGQQRLTTLFLIHWYIASRAGLLLEAHGWKEFTYATRQSARMFCGRLVRQPIPDGTLPSEWITDQPWYLFPWRHDPTIQSMLVMLDAIHDRFRAVDAQAAWTRLTDEDDPAVWFLFQPLAGLGSAGGADMRPEDLYIKMNSRGKPLTEFENFKAHFEKTIESSSRADEFARKVDTAWSDLLWHVRGDDDLIDDEFLRYMQFVTEVCEWRDGRTDGAGQRLGSRTAAIFGEANTRREEHLSFLLQAFDIWTTRSIPDYFAGLFTTSSDDEGEAAKVRLFFRADGSTTPAWNLFESCCRSYGVPRARGRVFSLGQGLILYAVLLHLIEDTPDFDRRVRILRNLVEASADELRAERMPLILDDARSIIRDGALEQVTTLNQVQVRDEKDKAAFLTANPQLGPALFALEDHEYLRGTLGAFELDAPTFGTRAAAFRTLMSQPALWPDLTRALLAVGEYQRQPGNARHFLFGTSSQRNGTAWRELLTGASRDRLEATRRVLGQLLDLVAASPDTPQATLNATATTFLRDCETASRFDWRYYMVKYPAMQEMGSSTFYAERADGAEKTAMGFSLCMLNLTKVRLSSYYRDPYLLAIYRALGDTELVEDRWFTGYEDQPRRMPLVRTGASLRCVPSGFELSAPDPPVDAFATVCADLNVTDGSVIVPQVEIDGQRFDTVDRIQLGAEVVRRMIAAGL